MEIRMANRQAARVGVYVDVANITSNGGNGMRYDVLREFATRDGAEPVRLNAYVTYDPERERNDPTGVYRARQVGFHSRLRDFGYKVIQKNYKWYYNEEGQRVAKANTDLDMAVDALLQSQNMDRVVLATGDGDFVRVVQALQNNGCRVEVVAFTNISSELRREADLYANGYLIPNLLPIPAPPQVPAGYKLPAWGQIGSRVRGVCNFFDHERGFGFFRVMKEIAPELWITDSRQEDSPYESVYFRDTWVPRQVRPDELPSRNIIFEFDLKKREDQDNMQADNILYIAHVGGM
jgi:uncharacterized LabA/DUF88 family protein